MARTKGSSSAVRRRALTDFTKVYGASCAAVAAKTGTPRVYLRSGVPAFDDYVLYGKGIPCGRITELHGESMSGKSTLALHIAAQLHRDSSDAQVFYFDTEGRFDYEWASKCGIDLERFVIVDYECGEDLLDKVTSLVALQAPLVIVDSVAGIVPRDLSDVASLEDVNAKLNLARAQLLTFFGARITGGFRAVDLEKATKQKYVGRLTHSSTALIFINHWKEKMRMSQWAPMPDGTVGGKTFQFFCSLRVAMKKKNVKDDELSGARVFCRKSSIAPPDRDAVLTINFRTGELSSTTDWFKTWVQPAKILKRKKSLYVLTAGPSKLKGRALKLNSIISYLTAKPERMVKMDALIRRKLKRRGREDERRS